MFARLCKALIELLPSVKYVVWYQDARTSVYPRAYLTEGWKGVKYYSPKISDAIRFDSEEAALEHVPVYDGSGHMEQRTGVMMVPHA